MNAQLKLSQARPSDRKQLIQLWQHLDSNMPANAFGSSPAGKKKLYQRLARQITAMDHGFALLGWLDDQIVATISGHLYDKPEALNTPVGILYNLWVEPHARRKGLATMLADEAEQRLKTIGARSLQVAWREDDTAEAFWRQRGFGAYETLAGKAC